MFAKTTSTLLILLAAASVNAMQKNDFRAQLLKAKKLVENARHESSESRLLDARAEFERLSQDKEMGWLADYYVAYADYRLAVYQMSRNETAQQTTYLDHGIDRLDRCLEKNEEFADAGALQANLIGQKINASPALTMDLGMILGEVMADALRRGPSNPRVAMFSALNAYFTPVQFGGSKIKALEEMGRAVHIFDEEEQKDQPFPDWGHDEALTWLARMQMEAGQNEAAQKTIAQALKLNPGSGFARSVQSRLQERQSSK